MNLFYSLPTDLQDYIFEFDSTFHEKYKRILNEIAFLSPHRFFYHDTNDKICYDAVRPENIDAFLRNRFNNFTLIQKNYLNKYLNSLFSTNKRIDIFILKPNSRFDFTLQDLPIDNFAMERSNLIFLENKSHVQLSLRRII